MAEPERHKLYEDMLALLTGTLLVAVGMAMFAKIRLLTGGTAGLSLLVHYASGWPFWLVFSLVNLPFYVLAVRQMGWAFTLRTFCAVSLVSGFAALMPQWLSFSALHPVFGAIFGGIIAGTGLLMLFRHRTGLGGLNILAIYLQERFSLRAGWVQLGIDLAILACAVTVLSAENLALSVLGALVTNLVLAINHKPGRYMGLS